MVPNKKVSEKAFAEWKTLLIHKGCYIVAVVFPLNAPTGLPWRERGGEARVKSHSLQVPESFICPQRPHWPRASCGSPCCGCPAPLRGWKLFIAFLHGGGARSYRLIKPQTDSSAVGGDHKCCYNSKRPEMTDGAFSRLCHRHPQTQLPLHSSASGPCSMG